MNHQVDVRFGGTAFERALDERFDGETGEVLRLSAQLCAIPGVSVPADKAAIHRLIKTCRLVRDYAGGRGLRVYELEPDGDRPYPFLIVTFGENDLSAKDFTEAVALIGHLDVVPSKHGGQFSPLLRGVDLYARGAADMKTVVATYLAWMARLQGRPGPKPPFVLLLSTCEENGSNQPHHVRSAVEWLQREHGVTVRFGLVGERTGELEWMGENLVLGPVCTENRSWRWLRFSGGSATGMAALERIVRLVTHCRRTVAEMNLGLAADSRSQRQPGLRSGFLNPFTFVAGVPGVGHLEDAVTLTAVCEGGPTFHSASADAARSSLLEQFAHLALEAESAFGSGQVHFAGLKIGEEGNFNTSDGSGEMRLLLSHTGVDAARAWAAGREEAGISLTVRGGGVPRIETPTAAGLDIRELLDHREMVEQLLSTIRENLGEGESLEVVHDLPPWRCPAEQTDLARLLEAYEAVAGEPSPELVKLHGNDGGNLVAWQHSADAKLAGRGEGHAVTFGQAGMDPHGSREFHRGTSIRPYIDVLDRWALSYLPDSS